MTPIEVEKEYYTWGYTGFKLLEALGLPIRAIEEENCNDCICMKCEGCPGGWKSACSICTVGEYITKCPDYKRV